jgi:hypothetical protein
MFSMAGAEFYRRLRANAKGNFAVPVGPEHLRQVFNDADEEVLWLVLGATLAITLAGHPK